MKRSRRISAIMHKLLIESSLDGFTVLEARDLWLQTIDDGKSSSSEVKKTVYRAIYNFEKKSWLRSEGTGRSKRYFQTAQFKMLPDNDARTHQTAVSNKSAEQDYAVLRNERNEYKGELEIVLGEIDEYQSIVSRFPDLESRLALVHQQAKERAALLLGKINALTTALNTLSTGNKSC